MKKIILSEISAVSGGGNCFCYRNFRREEPINVGGDDGIDSDLTCAINCCNVMMIGPEGGWRFYETFGFGYATRDALQSGRCTGRQINRLNYLLP
jgi:hypothetical protein